MRKLFLLALIASLLVVSLAGCGDDKKSSDSDKIENITIGFLNPLSLFEITMDGMKTALAEQGFTEGENVTYVYNGAVDVFDVDALAVEAQALVDANVDIIVTFATPGGLAAQQVTSEIPIIFGLVTDPVGAGLVETWQKPGGNITGVANPNPETQELRLLTRVSPDIKRVYIPLNEDSQPAMATLELLEDAAKGLEIELVTVPANNAADIEEAAANMPDDIDAIFIMPDILTGNEEFEPLWGGLAQERGIPLSYPGGGGAAVAVLTYGSDLYASGEQMARLVAQVIRGTDPSGLPVEQEEFKLTLNLPNAERYGIEIPDDLLRQADTIVRE